MEKFAEVWGSTSGANYSILWNSAGTVNVVYMCLENSLGNITGDGLGAYLLKSSHLDGICSSCLDALPDSCLLDILYL
jgi:hypothetical protein